MGFYVAFLNDGNATISRETNFKEYTSTCSRLMINNPVAIAAMNMPNIPNLRKLARNTHFVSTDGNVLPFPGAMARFTRSGFVSDTAGCDNEVENENSRLRKFLENAGLASAEDGGSVEDS